MNEQTQQDTQESVTVEKTRVRTTLKGVGQCIVEANEYSSAMGVAFNNLQEVIFKSIDSMLALSPSATVTFLKNIQEQIVPMAETQKSDYEAAIAKALESIVVEILADEEYEQIAKEMKETGPAQQDEQTNTTNSVETGWEGN